MLYISGFERHVIKNRHMQTSFVCLDAYLFMQVPTYTLEAMIGQSTPG